MGYFVCSGWCGVEVRVNGCSSEGGVLKVPFPGLGFWGGRCSSFFPAGWCLIGVVGVYSCFAIGGGEYRRLIHPDRCLVDNELYREDWCVFILWVRHIELVRYEPAVYMSAELF